MKPSKVFFVIGIMLITTIHTNAQTEKLNEINSLSTDIFSLINNINNNVDAFFNAENTKRLIRELDYFQNDLKRYLIARKELMIVLEENNYNIDFKETQLKVNNLKNELKRLSDRLRKISSYVSSNLSSSAMNIIDRIEQAQYSQKKIYLSGLDKFLRGEAIDKATLKNEGERIYKELENASKLISNIRIKINKK